MKKRHLRHYNHSKLIVITRITLTPLTTHGQRSDYPATVKENDTHMTMDYTRRGLLRAATLAGIGAALLPGTTLLPAANAAAKTSAPPTSVMVKGWLLNESDR
ncbi:MAG: hypothetical protein ACTH5D_15735 [Halomonas sp.]|uniref:hypothetical protein n=1 Tax=Halomonas sp. TaxID=1486246 RepID=UPI003F90AB13